MKIKIKRLLCLLPFLLGLTINLSARGLPPGQGTQPQNASGTKAELLQLWSEGLGETKYGNPGFKFEVTFMKIDVADIEARLTPATAAELESVVLEGKPNRTRVDKAAAILQESEISAYRFIFLRDGGTGRFMDGTRSNLDSARKDRIISEPEYLSIWNVYQEIMRPVSERGSYKGDQLLYRIDKGGVRIIYLGKDGDVLVDSIQSGEEWSRGFKGLFTSRDSAFRKNLIRSLWEN